MQTTTNYLLKKPDPSDAYDKQNDNGNMDLIDGQMKANADSAIAAQNTADAAETPVGAQAKADAAESSAKTHADTKNADLAGAGRTTETVKGNADAVATHLADTTAQDVGGTGTAITITLQSFAAYTNNYLLTFIAGVDNGGAATTININGLGAKSVYKPNTIVAPKFIAGKAYTVWYDSVGGNFFWKASAEGTAVAGDVLATKTFSNDDDSGIVGTMPNNGALGTITPTTTNQNIPAGYTSGGTVAGDVDLVASKIKNGVDIFGVIGSVLEATGAAADIEVLSGKTFSRAGAVGRTGTMPNRGTVNITPSTVNQAIASGYHSGAGVVYGDADLIAGNIKSGVDIFGVVGTLEEVLSIASNVWLSGSETERFESGTTYVKKKEITIAVKGVYRVTFQLKRGVDTTNAYARIYKNLVAYGTERITSSETYVTYTEDLSFEEGDEVQLYLRSSTEFASVYIFDFKIGSNRMPVISLN